MSKIKIFILVILGLLVVNGVNAGQVDRATAPVPELVKMEGNSAVYYKAVDGKRYVFPNQRIYQSWFSDFSEVRTITTDELYALQIGGNVCYKPNSRLVKVTTDPRVYWVDKFCVLRHVTTEALAKELFGDNWAKKVDDLSDAFFTNYHVGDPIETVNLPEISSNWAIDDNKDLFLSEEGGQTTEGDSSTQNGQTSDNNVVFEADEQPVNINLTVTAVDRDVTLEWFADGGNTNYGVAIVKSESQNPTYPESEYIILSDKSAKQYVWQDLPNGGAYYFRVCRLNSNNTCGTYSDQESLLVGVGDKTKAIVLSGEVVNGVAKLTWQTEWLSPNYGFYLVRNREANPSYPTHPNIWLDKTHESYDWQGLSGVQHFRVCQYAGSGADVYCSLYSNDLELKIQ